MKTQLQIEEIGLALRITSETQYGYDCFIVSFSNDQEREEYRAQYQKTWEYQNTSKFQFKRNKNDKNIHVGRS